MLWISMLTMLTIGMFIFFEESQIPQKEISVTIDVSHRINICEPEEGFGEKKSFF